MILCSNPHKQYQAYKMDIDAAIQRVLDGGWYILGEEVTAFEHDFAAYLGAKFGVGVGSGTEALHIALRACGIGPGDEVITVAHTAVATVAAIELCGAGPVLVDIEPDYVTMDANRLEDAISAQTKAIIPVHLYGHPDDMESILDVAHRHNLRVIEDCAQAHGAVYRGQRVGTWGDLACFSFYPTKNLGALGDGGMVISSDGVLAERVRLLREYGWAERYVSHMVGWNTRLDALQAAILRVKLPHLDHDNAARARVAALYDEGLARTALTLPRCRPCATHVYHLYVVRSSRRAALQQFLKARGVGALVHYAVPVHLQPAYRGRLRGSEALPETEQAAHEVLSLPLYPELGAAEVQTVIQAVQDFQETHDD